MSVSLHIFSSVFSLVSFPRICAQEDGTVRSHKYSESRIKSNSPSTVPTLGRVLTATSCPLHTSTSDKKQRQNCADSDRTQWRQQSPHLTLCTPICTC